MSDPMNRPVTPPPPADPPPPEAQRKSASPLIWLLVLIALLAFGWYFYSQRSATMAPEVPPTPIGDGTTPDADVPAARTPARTPPRAAPGPAATDAPANREATAVADRIEPEYPAELRRVGQEGSVVLTVDVDAAGKPSNVQVKRRATDRAFDRAAVAAVEQWTFEPARRDGKAVASQVEVPIDFRMQP